MTTSPQQAEQLWVSAHEHVRRGDFASATRDLAACFAILQEHNDPRLPEVHRRWTEVHQLAVEEAAQGRSAPATTTQQAPNLEAEAEAAVNAGDLDGAIALYERALAQRPDNELIAERLIELKNARPRAAELTSSAPPTAAEDVASMAFDDTLTSPAATIVRDEAVEQRIHVEPIVDDEPASDAGLPAAAIVRDEAVERSIHVEPIVDDEPGLLGDIHSAVTLVPQRPSVDDSFEAQHDLPSEPVADAPTQRTELMHTDVVRSAVPQWGEDLMSTTSEAPISGEDPRWSTPIEPAPTVEPEADPFADLGEPLPAITGTSAPEHIEHAAEQITGDDPRWGATSASLPTSIDQIEHAAEQITGDDLRWGAPSASLPTSFDQVEPAAEQITGDDPRWAAPSMPEADPFADLGDPLPPTSSAPAPSTPVPAEPAIEAIDGDDPRQGAPPIPEADPFADLGDPLPATPTSSEQITGDDPRWGAPATPVPAIDAISGDDPRWGAPSTPVPAQPTIDAISGDDPRWGAPATPVPAASAIDAISGDDPRWGAPSTPVPAASAIEAISGDDPRWGGPTPTTAPLMAAEDAPVGMPSLDLAIDIGASVSGAEADDLPVEITDDLEMIEDDAIESASLPPQPAAVAAVVAASAAAAKPEARDDVDGLPQDPTAMLEALLLRVRHNRRAA